MQRRSEAEEVEVLEVVEEVEVAKEADITKNIHRGLNESQTDKSFSIYPRIA